MTVRRDALTRRPHLFAFIFLLGILSLTGCANEYIATFDEIGTWARTDAMRPDVTGRVVDGAYVLSVQLDDEPATYWASASERFDNGIFEVEATQLSGPENSGYGMMFRLDEESGSFYLFEVSADGYVWIGRCNGGCEAEAEPLIGDWWFPSPAVRQGLNTTNTLRVRANDSQLTFYLNGIEIGRAIDSAFSRGDIAVMVESFANGDVTVAFDNFSVRPLEE